MKLPMLGVVALAAITSVLAGCGGMSEAEKHYKAGVDFQVQGRLVDFQVQRRLEEAIAEYDEAIRLDPEFAPAYGNRGAAYGSLGRSEPTRPGRDPLLQRAIEDLDKAIHFDPQLTIAYADRAVAHTLLGLKGKANQDVKRAVELGFDCTLLIRAFEEALGRRGFEESAYYLCDAPDFKVNLYQGDEFLGANHLSLSDLQGKPLVLNFWASSVPPHRGEVRHLQEFYDEHVDRVNLLGLDVGPLTGLSSQQDAMEFLEEFSTTYSAGYALTETVIEDYGILGVPSTVFITADGKIFSKWMGAVNKDVLVRITEEMLTFSEPTR